jgi:hypothetical protein
MAALVVLCAFCGIGSFAQGELPIAVLSSVFPMGCQRGEGVDVTLAGTDLDGLRELMFSHAGISAMPNVGSGPTRTFHVTVDRSVPPGWYEVRAVGLFGVTNPRTFEVCEGPARAIKAGGGGTLDSATEIPVSGSAYAVAEPNASHFYRIRVKARQPLWIEVATTQLDSRMEPVTVVADSSGRELARGRSAAEAIRIEPPAEGNSFVSIHDVVYHGGPEFGYRVRVIDHPPAPAAGAMRWPCPPAGAFLEQLPPGISWDAAEGADGKRPLNVPCEIAGAFRTPRQRDLYTFDAAAGTTYRIEIVSQRLGEPTSPFLLVQRAAGDGKGIPTFSDVQEVYAPPTRATIPEFPLGHLDPVYRLEAKQAGRYRLMVRDLYARDRGDAPAAYRLSIRPESPGFELVAIPSSPLPEPADSKDVPVWTTFLRRGGTAPVEVIADRRDGFAGRIELHVGGLPPGVTAGPANIPEGATTATLILHAAEDASSWVGPIRITGTARIAQQELCHVARPGTVSFSTYDATAKTLQIVRSRLCDRFVIAVSDVDAAPISITPVQKTCEVQAGTKATLTFNVKARAPFTAPIVLTLSGQPGLSKTVTIDPKSPTAVVELDLAQAKLAPGNYTLHFVGQAKLKYPDSPPLREARIALIDLEDRQSAASQSLAAAAHAFVDAVRSQNARRAVDAAKVLALTELSWLPGRQSVADMRAKAEELAAHAPAKDLTTSVYSDAFELKVDPMAARK